MTCAMTKRRGDSSPATPLIELDERLAPTVLDLFCGAGGLSVGFAEAGYKIVGGIDSWDVAVDSFEHNVAGAKGLVADLSTPGISEIDSLVGPSGVDVIIGGPSCQGFSTSGGLSRASGRDEKDPRNRLFINYLEIVDHLRPSWIVFENVPGLLLYNNGRVARAMAEAFREIGYQIIPIILLAADFGVPQLRRRLVFIGNRTRAEIAFPAATHGNPELWKSYALPFAHLSRIGHTLNAGARAHVSFGEACGDLPALKEGQRIDNVPYPQKAATEFQKAIRRRSRRIRQHEADVLPPLDRLAAQVLRPGDNWRNMPPGSLPDRFSRIRSYDATTLLKRLRDDLPAYTITTKFNEATTGAFIHPDQPRTLSLREAARLQTFPDRFVFSGTTAQVRHQIGNAVPPLLAQAIAEAILPLVVRDTRHVSIRPLRDVVLLDNPVGDSDILKLRAPRNRRADPAPFV